VIEQGGKGDESGKSGGELALQLSIREGRRKRLQGEKRSRGRNLRKGGRINRDQLIARLLSETILRKEKKIS